MGALLEIEVWSALMTLVCPVPKVQGGSAEITSSGCFRQILKNMWQSLCLLQMRCAVWKEWIFSSNTPEEKTCKERKRNDIRRAERKDVLGLLLWAQTRSQLTTCTKARAKRYLRCRCAMSSQSLLPSSNVDVHIRRAQKIKYSQKMWRKNSKKFHHFETLRSCYCLLKSVSSLDSLPLIVFSRWSSFLTVLLFWFWCVKDAEWFYTVRCCASRARRWSRSRPQGSSLTRGDLPWDLDNPHYTWTEFLIGICIRSWRQADMFSIMCMNLNHPEMVAEGTECGQFETF